MGRELRKQIGLLMALGVLVCASSNARADFVDTGSPNASSAAVSGLALAQASDPWVPYRSEFSEISGYLGSSLKARGGLVAGPNRGGSSASLMTEMPQSSSEPSPEPVAKLETINLYASPAAETGMAGAPSNASPDGGSPPQSCLSVVPELIFFQVVSGVIAEEKMAPPRPFHPDIFHPPRA